jgi:hypothetical protein
MKKQNNDVLPVVRYKEKDRKNGWFEEKKNFCPPPVVVVTALLSGVFVLAQYAPPKR